MENSIPTLSDLIGEWLRIHFPTEVKLRGPDEWYAGFYYIDSVNDDIWIADIDNNNAEIALRGRYSGKYGTLLAADPEMFTVLEAHIRRRLEEIKEDGGGFTRI